MELNRPDQSFDELIRQEMSDFHPTPPEGVWGQIENTIGQNSSIPSSSSGQSLISSVAGKVGIWITAAAISAGSIYFMAKNSHPNISHDSPTVINDSKQSPNTEQLAPADAIQKNMDATETPINKENMAQEKFERKIPSEEKAEPKGSMQQKDVSNEPSISTPIAGVKPEPSQPHQTDHPVASDPKKSSKPIFKEMIEHQIEVNMEHFPEVKFTLTNAHESTINWDFGDGHKQTNGPEIIHNFTNTDTFTTVIKADWSGQENPILLQLPIPSAAKELVPDYFTPNGDHINDVYEIDFKGKKLENFNITITNMKGEIVFSSNQPNFKWDGTRDGNRCSVGQYFMTAQWKEMFKTTPVKLIKPIYLLNQEK